MTAPDSFAVIEGGRLQPWGLEPLEACRDLGFNTILVTSSLAYYLRTSALKALIDNYVDEVIETDITDSAEVTARLAAVRAGRRLRGVFAVTEYCVPVAARVARALDLPGLSPDAAVNARHKTRTRRLCAAAGVPVPDFAWVRSPSEARAAATRVGLPCVVKPISEAGGIGVRLCRSPDEAAAHYSTIGEGATDGRGNPRPRGALVEAYLAGCEVSVEIVRTSGGYEVIGVTDALFGAHPSFIEVGQTFPSLLPAAAQSACAEVAISALRAIGHDFGAAHVEVKVTRDGPKLMEVNARLPGAQITRLIHEASGLNLPREVIRMHAGFPPDLRTCRRRAAAVRYPLSAASGIVTAVQGFDVASTVPGVVEVATYAGVGDAVRSPEHDGDVTGHVIAVAETPGEAVLRAEAAVGQLSYLLRQPYLTHS